MAYVSYKLFLIKHNAHMTEHFFQNNSGGDVPFTTHNKEGIVGYPSKLESGFHIFN